MSVNHIEDLASGEISDSDFAPAVPDGHGPCELTGVLCEIRQVARIGLPWPSKLEFRYGAEYLLRGMEVYHDFNWLAQFSHDKSVFPSCSYLARHVVGKCPQESKPAILLTTRAEVQALTYLERRGRFIVVVNINDYLNHVKTNPATTFIASPLASRFSWLAKFEESDLQALKSSDPQTFAILVRVARKLVASTSTTQDDVVAALDSLPTIEQLSIDAIISALLRRGTDVEVILQRLLAASNADDLSDAFEWMIDERNVDVVKQLSKLQGDSLRNLTAISNIVSLRKLLEFWTKNKDNHSEQFWQNFLRENLAVLSQLFAFPIVVIQDQAYVGGKRFDNRGGSIADFLCKNARTSNVAIIEIKTPTTSLLSSPYRGGIYNIGTEVTGATIQVANQRDKLVKRCYEFSSESSTPLNMFSPRCVVLAGDTSQLADDRERIQSFELFRQSLTGIELVTFDELFGRAQLFIEALGPDSAALPAACTPCVENDGVTTTELPQGTSDPLL